MKELRSLTSFVLDPFEFKARHGKLLSIIATQVDEGLMSVLVQFYDPLYRCFTFPDFQLLPTLEEYAHLVGIPILHQLSFSGLERVPFSQEIVDRLHINVFDIGAHCRITRKTGGKRKKQQSRHRALFIPKEGKETLEVNLGKNMVSRPKRMGSGVGYAKGRHRHQSRSSSDWGNDTCSLGYRILCIRIFSDERRIRAFVARLTRTQTNKGKGKHGARMPITGLTSASEPKRTQRGKRGAQMPITGLTLTSEPKHTQETNCQSLDLCRTPTRTHTRVVKTQRVGKEKGRPERSAQSPAYILHLTRLAQEARVSIATRARERGGLDRNEGERKERSQSHRGERKELVLVVSQTRQDIASRAYVSHMNMRIRVAVVRLNNSKHGSHRE
ncbi:hypothetical protein KIW84_035273 [Lathyrus oleraceus]|uniref:DUF7745 domain-containing protein n=1 Tax=Pisum sativum TaxID=3888 RepID=A0A9D4Y1P9_PEA|nr:hypothetical protein KIW84_035273 [Pisum sativum]